MENGAPGEEQDPEKKIVPVDEGNLAEDEEGSGSSFGIWIYAVPIMILAAWPALKLYHKATADTIDLTDEDANAFHVEAPEKAPEKPVTLTPELDDRIMNVRYKTGAERTSGPLVVDAAPAENGGRAEGTAAEAKPSAVAAVTGQAVTNPARQAPATPAPARAYGSSSLPSPAPASFGQTAVEPMKAREQQTVGYTRGLITGLMEKAAASPKAVSAVFNNGNIVGGFMARATVKSATGSVEGLNKYLKGPGPANFVSNPIVQAAVRNPAVVSALATSGMVKAMLETPAAKELMRDPQALDKLIAANPQLTEMAAKNPEAVRMLTSNPDVARLLGQFKTGSRGN